MNDINMEGKKIMRDFDLRGLQLAELQMLKDFAKFCDENDITYFLSDGTLLGAIRHQGFIPWDDDIDVCMDVHNYRKLLKVAPKKLPKKYFFQNYRTDYKVGVKWSRVRINGTTSMERNMTHYDIHYGVCMDIFVMAGIPKSKIRRKIQKEASHWLAILLEKYGNEAAGFEVPTKLKLLYEYIPDGLRLLICKFLERMVLVNTAKCDLCYSTEWLDAQVARTCLPTRIFSVKNREKRMFEDTEFYVPGRWKEYLELVFGDWKKLPPEAERVGHGDIIVDLENDYSIYFTGEKNRK